MIFILQIVIFFFRVSNELFEISNYCIFFLNIIGFTSLFLPLYNCNLLLPPLVFCSGALSRYLFIFSFSFSKVNILVFNRTFSSTTSLRLCFSWRASEYNLYLSWWIFFGKILAKSCIVRSGLRILGCCLPAWRLLFYELSSGLACPQYPRCPGLADCGLYEIDCTSSSL